MSARTREHTTPQAHNSKSKNSRTGEADKPGATQGAKEQDKTTGHARHQGGQKESRQQKQHHRAHEAPGRAQGKQAAARAEPESLQKARGDPPSDLKFDQEHVITYEYGQKLGSTAIYFSRTA